MNDRRDVNGNLLPDDVRLTKIGAFVRKTSFDELPQLLNIIKGDMSFVGPRPLLPQYLPLYNEFQRRRHEGRPGMTGWAQINGRNAISWNQKFQYDIEYLENITLLGDMTIFFTTLAKVVKSEGINSDETITMLPFTGNEE